MTSKPSADFLLVGASELVTCAGNAPAVGAEQSRVAVIENGAIAARDGMIVWVGKEKNIDAEVDVEAEATRLDAGFRAVLPGLVDTHTHMVWAGDRGDEFDRRLEGATYSEILAAGGGILRTVDATRQATFEALLSAAGARLERMSRWGTTSVEVKSGYGLEPASEYKMLETVLELGKRHPQELVPTFLGAHTLPREARGSQRARERYVDLVCEEMIPTVAKRHLARFVDVFIDEHAFGLAEARRVLESGRRAGLGLKIHADQLSSDGGAELAGELGAVSADHLEHLSPEGMSALAQSGTVAVMLPGATLFLRSHAYANGRALIEAGVPVAVATDVNPGSCPSESMPLMMQLACLYCGLSVDEAIVAGTANAAAASGLEDRCGSLEPGKRCDLLVLDAPERRQLIYKLGSPQIHMVVARGLVLS